MTIPRIRFALCNEFTQAVANEAEGCELPLGFRGQTVVGQEHAVLHADVAKLCVQAVARQAFALTLALVLAREVRFCGEVLFVDLGIGVVQQEALTDKDALVHTVRAPFAEVVGLQPTHTNHWVIAVGGVAQVEVNHGFVVGQLVSPSRRVGQGALHNFGVGRAVDALQPGEVFRPKVVGHLGLVHVEGRHGGAAGNVIPRVVQVVIHLAHGERTSFHENQTGARFLFEIRRPFKAAILIEVVRPTCSAGALVITSIHGHETHGDCEQAVNVLLRHVVRIQFSGFE